MFVSFFSFRYIFVHVLGSKNQCCCTDFFHKKFCFVDNHALLPAGSMEEKELNSCSYRNFVSSV